MEKDTSSEQPNEVTREEANALAFAEHGGDFGNGQIKESSTESTATSSSVSTEDKIELPSLQPPPQWRGEAKALWDKMPRDVQEENIRVFKENFNGPDSTLAKFHREQEQFKSEKQKYEPYEALIAEAQRFARANGEKEPTPKQIVAALQLTNDMRGQRASTIVDVLEAQGLPVSEKLREAAEEEGQENGLSEKKLRELVKNTIQESISPIQERLALEDHLKYRQEMSGHWESFRNAKNDAGGTKYLDIQSDEDPRSLQLQSAMAHLVAGQTDFSKQFIASETARNPNITQPELFARAYEFYGGKVDLSSKAPSEKTNLQAKHRAAASSPGRGTSGRTVDLPPKGLTREQANAYAFKKLKEEGLIN